MLKNVFPYSNYKHASHVRQLPHILKINLHTKLDDGKDLKCKIDDKTKNELKEKIKNELEKDLKYEIDDKTKGEIKDKIKKEIEDEIDCKRDKNGHDKGDKGKEGYDKDGFNKDGFNEKGYDKDGYDKGSYDRDGYNEDGYNRNGYDKDVYNEDGYDKQGHDRDGKVTDDKGKPDTAGEDDKDKVEKTASITSQEITLDHADATKCGSVGSYYKTYSQVGRQGFTTSDLLEVFYPEMYSNPKIAEHLKMGSKVFYGAVNYKFAFSEPFDYSWGNASNMWCKKCSDNPTEIACQGDEIKSFCYPAGYFANQDYNKSFFAEKVCPNLVKVSGTPTIKAKQVAPLILVDSSGQMIDKEGNNTQITYASLQPYLRSDGHIKDCAGDAKCKSFAEIMKKVAWDNDKEVLLKTVSDDVQKANPYYYGNEDNSISVDTDFI